MLQSLANPAYGRTAPHEQHGSADPRKQRAASCRQLWRQMSEDYMAEFRAWEAGGLARVLRVCC